MNLTKANMKKLLLLIAGGVVLNAAVQHLDLLGVFLRVALGLSVGQERLYAVRSVADLLTCFALGTPLRLSAKFTYRPEGMRFSREDERLLTLLMNHIPLRTETLRQQEEDRLDAAPSHNEQLDRRELL